MSKPLLAITMGDPAGVGAEIVVKAFSNTSLKERATPFVIGSAACLQQAMAQTGHNHQLAIVNAPEDVIHDSDAIQVLEAAPFNADDLGMGQVSASCGAAAVGYY